MALIKTNSWIAMRTKLLFRSTKTLSFESTNIDRAEANDRSASRCFIRAKQTTASNYISTCHRDFFAEPTNVFSQGTAGPHQSDRHVRVCFELLATFIRALI